MPPLLCAVVLVLVVLTSVACGGGGGENASEPLPEAPAGITVRSSAFAEGATIPTRYTCDGDDDSPELSWSGVPPRAKELALVVDDPTAGHYVHWTVVGIPPTVMGAAEDEEPKGGTELANSAGDDDWTGPCPPEGDGVHVFSDEDAWDVLEEIPNDSAAALILLEHHWAVPLRDAIARAGGFRLSAGFISPLDLVEIGLVSAEEAKELHAIETSCQAA